MKKFAIAAAAAALTAVASPASAALMLGKTVSLSYYFPDQGSLFEGPYNNVVGTTGATNFFGQVDVTPSDMGVTIRAFCGSGCTFTGASFNGVVLSDVNNMIGAFTGVTQIGGPAGVGISFDADNIRFNLQGLSANDTYEFSVSGSAVPEPATWAMLIVGFGLVGLAARRRRELAAA